MPKLIRQDTCRRKGADTHRAPHIMGRDGWPELLTWIMETAELLGVDMKEIGIC